MDRPVADKIVGLTTSDISAAKGALQDWGVFGLGQMPGSACVVSTFRLQRGVDKQRFESRLGKVVVHEVGHTFGLPHCPKDGCVMNDAKGSVKTVDCEHLAFCPACRQAIGPDFLREAHAATGKSSQHARTTVGPDRRPTSSSRCRSHLQGLGSCCG